MKTYKHLYEKMVDPENIRECIGLASKRKKNRKIVQKVLNNIDVAVEEIPHFLDGFTFSQPTHRVVNENGKTRELTIIKFSEQIIVHLLMSQFKPIVLKSIYGFSLGSIPGKGVHYGKKYLEKWIRSYGNKRFYVYQCDIDQFYASIDHDILKEKLHRVIADDKYLELMDSLIDLTPGLPLGAYSSQWLSHFYLKEFDHKLKEVYGAKHYMRYMDDIVILDSNKRHLWTIKHVIDDELGKLGLHVNDNWQLYRFKDRNDQKGRDINFMGFRFFRRKTILRKKILKSIKRHIGKPGQSSLYGWVKASDTKSWYARQLQP